jgi:hypothetical protein
MRIFTQTEETKQFYEQELRYISVLKLVEAGDTEWLWFEAGDLRENLYAVLHDGLVVVGAYGHGVAKQLFFGSKMELIQTMRPNPMLIVEPGCSVRAEGEPQTRNRPDARSARQRPALKGTAVTGAPAGERPVTTRPGYAGHLAPPSRQFRNPGQNPGSGSWSSIRSAPSSRS